MPFLDDAFQIDISRLMRHASIISLNLISLKFPRGDMPPHDEGRKIFGADCHLLFDLSLISRIYRHFPQARHAARDMTPAGLRGRSARLLAHDSAR